MLRQNVEQIHEYAEKHTLELYQEEDDTEDLCVPNIQEVHNVYEKLQ
jgi:hypothetical protein